MKKILISIILGSGLIIAGCGTQTLEMPVDETSPTITISSPADNAVILENKVVVTGTVTDDGSGVKSVTVSGGGKSASATPDENGKFSATLTDLSDGRVEIVAQATDEQGNTASASVKVLIDTATPSVALISPSAGTYRGTIVLSASASDTNGITQVEFLRGTTVIGTDTTSPYSINFDTTTVADGNYSITARATDVAGNQTTSASVAVTVDNSKPTGVAVTSPANGTYQWGSITITASASDNNSITLVEFLVDGGVFASDSSSPYRVQLDTTTLSDGTHTLSVRATDVAGNQTTSAGVSITVDNTEPTISINSPICVTDNVCNATEAPGGIVVTSITVTTDAENGQTVTLFSNGDPIGTGTVSGGSAIITQGSPLTEGSNNLVACVTDLAGNSQCSTPPVNVTLDTILNIAIIFPTNATWLNDSADADSGTPGLQIDVTVSTDAETGRIVTVNGGDAPVTGPVSNGSAIIRVTFSTEGTKNLTASVSDNAGNGPATSSTVTIYYDKTAPTVTITLPVANQLFKSTCPGGTGPTCLPDDDPGTPLFQTTVSLSANDNLASLNGRTVSVYSGDLLVGTATLSGSGPWTASVSVSLRDGGNPLRAVVTDLASNTGTSPTVKTHVFVGEPGTISGGVYNPCTDSMISGAIVELSISPDYSVVIDSAITDAGGFFTLANVPPGEYTNIRACLDRDGNGRCEIKNGFGTDGQPGNSGVDDDNDGITDNCKEYGWTNSVDDTTVDFIGFYWFNAGYGPLQVRPGANVSITSGYLYTSIGNSTWPWMSGTCRITGQIKDKDTSWGNVQTIIATLDFMVFGDESPVNIRSWTLVDGGTGSQTFEIYEQQFAPSDGKFFIGMPFLLAAGKDLNGNGRPDLNSEPFTILPTPADCGTSGLDFTLETRAQIQGTISGNPNGWGVIASTQFGQEFTPTNMAFSATDVNADGTYTLTLFGNNTYAVLAVKDRDGFYLDQNNELTAMASMFPITVGTGTIGGVNISLPPVRTISGTVSGAGISNWAVNAGGNNTSYKAWMEPTSNYYLLEVLPGQYWVNAFNDRNANLDFDPREGYQDYGSPVDVGTSDASGIDISVTPDIRLRNVYQAPGSDGDRLAEPGETVDINVQFRNYMANATNVNATLSCVTNCTGITINPPNPINYANINFDVLTAPSAYSVTIDSGVSPGTKVTFRINITADGGYTNYQEFSIYISQGHQDGIPPGLPTSGAPVSTGTNPKDVAIAVLNLSNNERAYVANIGSQDVTVFDALSNAVITTIALTGNCPSSVAASPNNGTWVYVGSNCTGSVAVIDTSSDTVIKTINLGAGANASRVAVSPDGTELWVTSSYVPPNGHPQISVIETSTGSITQTIPLAGSPQEITFSPDGEQAFISNAGRVVVLNARGSRKRIQGNIPYVYMYDELGIDPYSLYLYGFDGNGTMYQVDIDTYSSSTTSFAGIDRRGSLAITPDGALLYFAESEGWGSTDNNVYVIDIPSLNLVGSFASATANNPNSAIAFINAGNKCWVTNYNDNTATPAQ